MTIKKFKMTKKLQKEDNIKITNINSKRRKKCQDENNFK